MAYVVFYASGSEYLIAGVFDNVDAARSCSESFTDRFSYFLRFPMNKPLPGGVSLGRP